MKTGQDHLIYVGYLAAIMAICIITAIVLPMIQ